MKRMMVYVGVVAIIAVALAVISQYAPPRFSAKRFAEAAEAQKKIEEAATKAVATETKTPEPAKAEAKPEAKPETKDEAKPKEGTEKAVEAKAKDANVFKVTFDTTEGPVVVEVHKDWAPIGAARFEEMVKSGLFTDMRIFRVVSGFVVQFGIAGDPAVSAKWRDKNIQDEPVKESNKAGTITFAKSSAPNSRTTQVFINLSDNARLDSMGFAPFGEVVEGMDIVRKFNSKYADAPTGAQGQIQMMGNEFLDQQFPGLSSIKSAKIVE